MSSIFEPIPCKRIPKFSLIGNFFVFVVSALLIAVTVIHLWKPQVVAIANHDLIFVWFLALFSVFNQALVSPGFTVHADGLILDFKIRNYKLAWDDINKVTKFGQNIIICIKPLTPFNRLAGVILMQSCPVIIFNKHRENSSLVIEIMRDKLGDKVQIK